MQEIKLKNNKSEYFELLEYPDGQRNIVLDLTKLDKKHPVEINCRIKNFLDLEVLLCLEAALYKNDFHYSIVFSYLFGVRDDRAFSEGQPNYFRDVVMKILAKSKAAEIRVLWPFIPLALSTMHHLDIISSCNHRQVNKFLFGVSGDYLIISGDESAKEFSGTKPSLHFIKKRKDGNVLVELSDQSIEEINEAVNLNDNKIKIMIVDDLCDGGATFIAEAKYLKQLFPEIELSLFVYHGLFTKGIDVLLDYYFEHIYCTNSYQDIDHPRVTQIRVI